LREGVITLSSLMKGLILLMVGEIREGREDDLYRRILNNEF